MNPFSKTLLILTFGFMACNSPHKKKPIAKQEHRTQETAQYSKAFKQSIERGEDIYNNLCVTCHLPNGKGVPRSFPPLAKSDYLMNKRVMSIKAIKYGLSGKIVVNGETYNTAMAPQGLSDTEVADVMNYITNSWGNSNTRMVTEKEVSEIKP